MTDEYARLKEENIKLREMLEKAEKNRGFRCTSCKGILKHKNNCKLVELLYD